MRPSLCFCLTVIRRSVARRGGDLTRLNGLLPIMSFHLLDRLEGLVLSFDDFIQVRRVKFIRCFFSDVADCEWSLRMSVDEAPLRSDILVVPSEELAQLACLHIHVRFLTRCAQRPHRLAALRLHVEPLVLYSLILQSGIEIARSDVPLSQSFHCMVFVKEADVQITWVDDLLPFSTNLAQRHYLVDL